MKLVKFVPAFVANFSFSFACFNNQEVAQIQQTQVAVAQATENAATSKRCGEDTGSSTAAELKVEKIADA